MEPIIRAILDSNLPEVRRLVSTDSKELSTKSESGRTLAQLAYAAENYTVTAAILRNSSQGIDEIPTSPSELLLDLIFDFSESTHCSSWNQNIEFELWALIIDDSEYNRDTNHFMTADRDSLSDIGWIASLAEGWFHWPDSGDSPTFIAMADWEERYKDKDKG